MKKGKNFVMIIIVAQSLVPETKEIQSARWLATRKQKKNAEKFVVHWAPGAVKMQTRTRAPAVIQVIFYAMTRHVAVSHAQEIQAILIVQGDLEINVKYRLYGMRANFLLARPFKS